MPYIITTTTRANVYGTNGLVEANVPHEVDRTAVATLDEAREEARIALTSRSWRTFAEAARATEVGQEIIDLPGSGGTVGPLPDGTVIEVRSATWTELRDVGFGKGYDEVGRSLGTDQIIAAFNAA